MESVKVICPECRGSAQLEVDYKPAGRGSTFTDKDGKKIDEQGFHVCDACKAQFVYKFSVHVECSTSKIKF